MAVLYFKLYEKLTEQEQLDLGIDNVQKTALAVTNSVVVLPALDYFQLMPEEAQDSWEKIDSLALRAKQRELIGVDGKRPFCFYAQDVRARTAHWVVLSASGAALIDAPGGVVSSEQQASIFAETLKKDLGIDEVHVAANPSGRECLTRALGVATGHDFSALYVGSLPVSSRDLSNRREGEQTSAPREPIAISRTEFHEQLALYKTDPESFFNYKVCRAINYDHFQPDPLHRPDYQIHAARLRQILSSRVKLFNEQGGALVRPCILHLLHSINAIEDDKTRVILKFAVDRTLRFNEWDPAAGMSSRKLMVMSWMLLAKLEPKLTLDQWEILGSGLMDYVHGGDKDKGGDECTNNAAEDGLFSNFSQDKEKLQQGRYLDTACHGRIRNYIASLLTVLDSLSRNAIPLESNSLAVNLKALVISEAPNLEEGPQRSYLQALQREMPLTIRVMEQLEIRIHELLDAAHNFLYNDASAEDIALLEEFLGDILPDNIMRASATLEQFRDLEHVQDREFVDPEREATRLRRMLRNICNSRNRGRDRVEPSAPLTNLERRGAVISLVAGSLASFAAAAALPQDNVQDQDYMMSEPFQNQVVEHEHNEEETDAIPAPQPTGNDLLEDENEDENVSSMHIEGASVVGDNLLVISPPRHNRSRSRDRDRERSRDRDRPRSL